MNKLPKTKNEIQDMVTAELRRFPDCGEAWGVVVVRLDTEITGATWTVSRFNRGGSDAYACDRALQVIVPHYQNLYDLAQKALIRNEEPRRLQSTSKTLSVKPRSDSEPADICRSCSACCAFFARLAAIVDRETMPRPTSFRRRQLTREQAGCRRVDVVYYWDRGPQAVHRLRATKTRPSSVSSVSRLAVRFRCIDVDSLMYAFARAR
jgi:hypothetical protein